jgi:hypothetical protein
MPWHEAVLDVLYEAMRRRERITEIVVSWSAFTGLLRYYGAQNVMVDDDWTFIYNTPIGPVKVGWYDE